MPRKTDAELLEELERTQRELAKAKKGLEQKDEYTAEPYEDDSDDESSEIEPKKEPKQQMQVVEREVTLGLINEKLNFIISKVQGLK